MSKKRSKDLSKDIKDRVKPAPALTTLPSGYYDENDPLKHFIRKYVWAERIKRLIRDNNPSLNRGIQYFSFCSRKAFDIRYFWNKNFINHEARIPFAFVEFLEDDFKFLSSQFLTKRKTATGFPGAFAEIATNTNNSKYGDFWASFPFDVINLDYLGDIFKTNHTGLIGVNDFFAIENVISKQFALRRPYELWITLRAKSGRYENVVKNEFRDIINANLTSHAQFKKLFEKEFGNNVNALNDDDLFSIGYMKWLLFVCKKYYCSVNFNKSEVVKYTRPKDKDGSPYTLYNIFLRIEPFEHIPFSSPVSAAARHCDNEYSIGIPNCLKEATNIDDLFNQLTATQTKEIQADLQELIKEYNEDNEYYIG